MLTSFAVVMVTGQFYRPILHVRQNNRYNTLSSRVRDVTRLCTGYIRTDVYNGLFRMYEFFDQFFPNIICASAFFEREIHIFLDIILMLKNLKSDHYDILFCILEFIAKYLVKCKIYFTISADDIIFYDICASIVIVECVLISKG